MAHDMHKKIVFLCAVALVLVGVVVLLKWMPAGTELVWRASAGGTLLMPLIVVASLIDSINPCAFSILLLTVAFLFSIGRGRSAVLKLGAVYIAGIFVVYMLIGLGILQVLHLFDTPHFMARVGALLLIVLGLINFIGEVFPTFPVRLKISGGAHHRMAVLMEHASMPTAFVLGVLVGLCEFPCTGGPYLMVLGLLHDSATYVKGFLYLLLYNLIFVLPLVIILLITGNESLVGAVRAWQQKERRFMRFAGGIAMMLLGLLILIL